MPTPKRSPSIANSQPRSGPGEEQEMRTRLPQRDAMRRAPALRRGEATQGAIAKKCAARHGLSLNASEFPVVVP
jgi:hypothetical protein